MLSRENSDQVLQGYQSNKSPINCIPYRRHINWFGVGWLKTTYPFQAWESAALKKVTKDCKYYCSIYTKIKNGIIALVIVVYPYKIAIMKSVSVS